MSINWPVCPPSLKSIQPTLKIALEHDDRDLVVAYWARVYALQVGLKQSTRQENEMQLLVAIMDWLEMFKRQHSENEAITNEVVAQAHLENYALKLFLYADKQDRSSNWNKNVVKAFFSSAVIYDVMQTFGELTEEVAHNRKYAKWKASYIHNCLKNGQTPVPGPMESQQAADEAELGGLSNPNDESTNAGWFDSTPQNPVNPTPPSTPSSPPTTPAAAAPAPFIPPPQPQPQPLPRQLNQKDDNLPTPSPSTPIANSSTNKKPTSDEIIQAQKFCKYAVSALNYDDISAAVENLQGALAILTTNN